MSKKCRSSKKGIFVSSVFYEKLLKLIEDLKTIDDLEAAPLPLDKKAGNKRIDDMEAAPLDKVENKTMDDMEIPPLALDKTRNKRIDDMEAAHLALGKKAGNNIETPQGKKTVDIKPIKVNRDETILQICLGLPLPFLVHNGRQYVKVMIDNPQLVGRKFGSLVPTTQFKKHGGIKSRAEMGAKSK